jgi:putative peptidoglycan lipid II flippase
MGRVRNVVNKANSKLNVQLAAALLAGSSLLSSGLGLFRERLLNSTYYFTYPQGLDAYTVAFIIPDFMFFVLVSGALSVSFIPAFNEHLLGGKKKSAWELSSSMINFMAILTLIASACIIIFADQLVRAFWPDFGESTRELTISMMRVIAINPFLFAVASVIASMQQAVGRFVFFALAPTIYNIGIIIGITVFANGITLFGVTVFEGGIMGVALGVVLGSIMQLIVSSIGLAGMGFDYQFKIFWKNRGFRRVLRLLPARSIDQGIDYFNNIVETSLASRIAIDGTIRAYNQATVLHMVPVTLIGVAISTAAFPKMTERLSQGRPDLFRKELRAVLRVIIWLALPTATIAFFLRGYVVSFIVTGGDSAIAGILSILVVAILFRSVYHIASRSFYAQQDTRTPLYISLFTIGLNITLAVAFTTVFKMGVYGLAWAQSIVSIIEVAILFVIMSVRIPGLFDGSFVRSVARMSVATVGMGAVTYGLVKMFDLNSTDRSFFTTFPKFALIASVSGVVYLLLSKLLGLSEANPVICMMKKILFVQLRLGGRV